MSTRDPDVAPIEPPVIDRVGLDRLAAAASPLTPYHDHDGSCVGVYVVGGRARNEPLVVGQPRRVHEYHAGDSFAFPGSGIHRMEHDPGAITIHVYSPPLRAVGHYELKDGELRREACPSDEPSGPSPGLLSAMTATSSDPNE
jgi:quercetin dioxygenase-like cupin family protein